MGGMEWIAIGATLAGAKAQKDVYELEAKNQLEASKNIKLQMESDVSERKMDLYSQLSSLQADRKGMVFDPFSGTSGSFGRRERVLAQRDISKIRSMGWNKSYNYRVGAVASKQAGKVALLKGIASASGQAYDSSTAGPTKTSKGMS